MEFIFNKEMAINSNCSYIIDNYVYKKCIGKYCGRILTNQTDCTYSECGRCPRGSRPSDNGICEPCNDESEIYDYMYLGFILTISIVLNFIFIDRYCCQRYVNQKQKKRLIVFYILPIIECTVSFLTSLLIYEPLGSLKLYGCKIKSINDWYSMFYNPYIDYYKKLNCTQEIVYPLYTIVFVFISFSIVLMILIRPLLIKRLFTNKQMIISLNNSIFSALHFYPILILVQALAGGLLYYSYPILTIIVFLITNVIHLTNVFKSNRTDNTYKNVFKTCISIYKQPRNILIQILHVIFYSYALIALIDLKGGSLINLLLLLLVPLPMLFFIISYKFTNPEELKHLT